MRVIYLFVCVLLAVMPVLGCGGGDTADKAAEVTENVAEAAGEAGEKIVEEAGDQIAAACDMLMEEMGSKLSSLDGDLKPLKEAAKALNNEDLSKHVEGIQGKVDEVRNSMKDLNVDKLSDLDPIKEEMASKLEGITGDMKKAEEMISDLKSKIPGQ